jgi:hypothetical protein
MMPIRSSIVTGNAGYAYVNGTTWPQRQTHVEGGSPMSLRNAAEGVAFHIARDETAPIVGQSRP